MTPEEFAQAKGLHDNKIDMIRDAWLRSFTVQDRIRLGLQEEWLQRTWPKYRKAKDK